jgi:hypothetical protein
VSGQTESQRTGRDKTRRPYEAPQLARVDLEAEEVLAVGCKLPRHSAAVGVGANCIVKGCASLGS